MRRILLLIACSCVMNSYGQSDSGKIAFKEAAKRDTPDYTVALRLLKKEIKQNPNNAEARYFLGYCLDRMNSDDGGRMYLVKKDRTIEASEQFEAVIKLQPKYQGELVVLDAYSKITSIWGSLAQAYLYRGLQDSATWALREGKQRGGFIEPVLHYNRDMLNSCSKNAILLTIGDNLFFPCLYLQLIEKYRTDITVADANLVGTSWYPKYLQKQHKIKFSLTDKQLDTLNYQLWQTQIITLTNPNNKTEQLQWILPPTFDSAYILKAEIHMLDFFRSNYFTRDIYFCTNSDATNNIFLDAHFKNEGLVDKVMPEVVNNFKKFTASENLAKYSIDELNASEIQNSPDAIICLNSYRFAYSIAIRGLYNQQNQDTEGTKKLAKEMFLKFDEQKLPYSSEEFKQYIENMRRILD